MYDYQKSAEAVLIRRAKRGDVKAFSELYSRIYVELYKFALYTLKHPQEAEDAVSDTVVTAYEKISSLKKEESFRSWIFTILSNHCKNQFRKRNQTHELDETYPSKESDYAVSQDVKSAFWKLDDEERLIVSFSVFGGYQSDEIGQMLDMNPVTVRSRKAGEDASGSSGSGGIRMENKRDRHFTEEEIEDKIVQSAEGMEVPDSLKPENIEKKLAQKKKKRTPVYGIVVAAACCCLVVGVVALSGRGMMQDKEAQKAAEKAADDTVAESTAALASAKDYDQIYKYVQAAAEEEEIMYGTGGADGAALYTGEKAVADQAVSHSDTNVRTEGVGEGDVVKTDGKYLYIMSMDKVQILNIESEEMKQVGTISMDANDYLIEIYLKDEKLVCVYARTTDETDSQGVVRSVTHTVAEVFDVSNPEKPKSLGEMSQSGSFHTMRVSGDYVYLLSTFYADISGSKNDVSSYVPEVQGKVMDSSYILLPQQEKGRVYTVVTSFSLKDPTEQIDHLAFFGDGSQCYVSENNIYVYDTIYDAKVSPVTQTEIRKVSYKNGELDGTGDVVIDGMVNDSFSIDEYNGYLRVVTTIRENDDTSGGVNPLLRTDSASNTGSQGADSTNALYILDKDLKETGKLDNLAEDERVYSARFMGDTCYFVTYKQVDPLFSVDLSDPKKPKVLGELKIPGFSDYLHPYGDGLLLGIGMDVEEDGTTVNGVKLSMFDISDPKDVKEVAKTVLEECYSTDVSYNYRAAFVDTEKNLIGFPGYKNQQEYYIYSYDKEKGFTCVFEKKLSGYSEVRGLYAGERFYLVTEATVESYRLDNFEKVDDVVL